jgi:large subunit ribosomal protein L25
MERFKITAELRKDIGVKGTLKNLRKNGKIPAVIYGGDGPTVTLLVQEKEISNILRTSNAVVKIKYGDKEDTVIVKEIQRNVVSDKLLHIDFQRILMTEKIKIKVPIKLTGEAYGIKVQAGILEYSMRDINVLCLPTEIPKEIEVDITELHIGSSIRIKDIRAEKVEVLDDPNQIVVSVVAAKEEVVEPVAATEVVGPEEPEVIGKGKKPEEEAGAEEVPKEKETKEKEAKGKEAKPEDKKTAPAK